MFRFPCEIITVFIFVWYFGKADIAAGYTLIIGMALTPGPWRRVKSKKTSHDATVKDVEFGVDKMGTEFRGPFAVLFRTIVMGLIS
jgi:hypothetical protein